MIDIADIQRISDLSKQYLAERKKYERLSDRAHGELTPKQAQKASTDLNWQAMALSKIEAALHVAAVDAGVADMREASSYGAMTFRPSGWHTYTHTPPVPRALQATGAPA